MKLFRLVAVIAATLILFACESRTQQPLEKLGSSEISDNKKIEFNRNPGSDDKEKMYEQERGLTDSTYRQQTQQPVKQVKDIIPVAKPDWDKKIIKTAQLNAEVKNFQIYYNSLREKVKSLGGYIAQEEQNQSDYKIENTVVIKVPVDQFDNALVQFFSGVEKVNEKKINSHDVTGEMIDTRSRMEAKKQIRLRYLDLLKQAKNMEDILSVQSEINGVQEEIEAADGRVSWLGHASSFSTINLTYYQVLNQLAKEERKPSFGKKMGNALAAGWGWVGDLSVGLATIWPVFLLVAVGVVYYKRTRAGRPRQA